MKILKDDEFVRYPTRIEFNSEKIEEGMFGFADRVSTDANDGYIIYIHEYFKNKQGDLSALVFYHIVTVNYGDFVTYNEAEEFASAALGMDKEYYYQYLCRLVDSIPKKGEIIMLGRIGLPELIFVFLVILLFFGAKALPEMAKGLAQALKIFKKEVREIKEGAELDEVNKASEASLKSSEVKKDISNDFNPSQKGRDWRPKTKQGVLMSEENIEQKPQVGSINISKGGIPKLPIDTVNITEKGLEGDGHNHEKHYRPDSSSLHSGYGNA